MLELPRFQPSHAVLLLPVKPRPRGLSPILRATLQVLRQRHLVREIVANHPLIPLDLHPVGVEPQPTQESASGFHTRRRWIEHLPAVSGEIHLDPAMRIAGAYDVVAREIVVFARKE